MIPLKLADGRSVDTSNGRLIRDDLVVVPSCAQVLQTAQTKVARKLIDLPATPKQMNVVSVVVSYSLFGLTDNDIATAVGLSETQVGQIKMSDAYTRMYNAVIDSIVEHDRDNVRTLIQRGSINAANRMISLVNDENPQIQLAASKDVLDRSGHRPADVVEHRHMVEGGLTIEYVRRDEDNAIPTIDVVGEELF